MPLLPLLTLKNLKYRWPQQTNDCLSIENWAVAQGETVFVHGESGSGKSTLLSLIGGLILPQSGELLFNFEGRAFDIGQLTSTQKDQWRVDYLGFIFQQFNLLPYLSMIDNVALPCLMSKRRRRLATTTLTLQEEVVRLLTRLDLSPDLHHQPVRQLSIGQQQRVAAARALIGQPALIIADEPTSALDAARQEGFLTLLNQACTENGSSLLFVSHDLRLSSQFHRQVALNSLSTEKGASC
jgi:putative ABC transport system ATP-binding protein